jgi:hypothetical protein
MSFDAAFAGLYDGLIPLLGLILSDWELSDSRWVGTRRVALRYVSSSPPLSTVHATFTAHGATPLVVLHGPP